MDLNRRQHPQTQTERSPNMFFIQTRDEIEEQERTILDLEAAVKAKEAPLKLAETRLENRDISHSLESQ